MTGYQAKWVVTYSYLRQGMPKELPPGEYDQLCEQLQKIADARCLARKYGRQLEFDGYTDQLDAFFRDDKGKRYRFAILMAE